MSGLVVVVLSVCSGVVAGLGTTVAEVVAELRSHAEAWRRLAESRHSSKQAIPRIREIEDEIVRVLADDARRQPRLLASDYTYRSTAGPHHPRQESS